MRRVAITGIGLITSIGNDVEQTWQGLLQGKSGIARITRFNADDYPSQIAAEVKEFQPKLLNAKEIRRYHPVMMLALEASQQALSNARLIPDHDLSECGVILGVAIGGASIIEESGRHIADGNFKKISPFALPMSLVNTVAGVVAEKFLLQGLNFVINSACASGAHAIGEAYKNIKHGYSDIVLTGGCESPLSPASNVAFSNMRAFNTSDNDNPAFASRPFHRSRAGFVIGEGAGILVLEELEHARKRGAEILGEIVGYGASADAHHISAPPEDGRGAQKAMLAALQEAGLTAQSIDYLNAHGTSTLLNDKTETYAIKQVFGEHAKNHMFVSSIKGHIGHCIGAAGAIETIVSLLALNQKTLPLTLNLNDPDEDCQTVNITDPNKVSQFNYALSNSFGFGGQNASIIIKGQS